MFTLWMMSHDVTVNWHIWYMLWMTMRYPFMNMSMDIVN